MKIEKNTFNSYQYDDLVNRENDSYAEIKYNLLLKYLKEKKKGSLSILNAGCGSGDLSILLAQAGHRVLGIDPSEEYINLAKERAQQNDMNCKFKVGSIEELSNEKYDCVISTDVLEHIEDDYGAMKKLCQSTKDGGLIIITVPALQSLFGFHDEQIGHFRRYNKKNLKKLVLSQGTLKLSKIRYFGFTLIPICYLFSCLFRKSYPVVSGEKGLKGLIQNFILKALLRVDGAVPMPVGTSLICVIERNYTKF